MSIHARKRWVTGCPVLKLPDAVVKANNLVSNIVGSFRVIGIVLLPNPLHFQIQEETLHCRVIPAVGPAAHAAQQAMLFQQRLMLSAGVLGVFNRSSQHLNLGGVYGTTRRVDEEVDGARSDALAGCAVAPA